MGKRTPALPADQMAFSFDTPRPAVEEGALADLETKVASAVATILKRDPRSRHEVAGQVSMLLDDTVTKLMLDAYAAPARDGHNISVARFLALIVATQQHDALRGVLREIGCSVMVGEEILLAEIGHLTSKRKLIDERLKALRREAQPIHEARR